MPHQCGLSCHIGQVKSMGVREWDQERKLIPLRDVLCNPSGQALNFFLQPLIHYKEIIVAFQVVQSNTNGTGNDHQQYLWDNNSFFILPTSLHLFFALYKSI